MTKSHAERFADAACVGEHDLFTSARRLSTWDLARARDLCSTCPVAAECASYADEVEPTLGVWAGRQWSPTGALAS